MIEARCNRPQSTTIDHSDGGERRHEGAHEVVGTMTSRCEKAICKSGGSRWTSELVENEDDCHWKKRLDATEDSDAIPHGRRIIEYGQARSIRSTLEAAPHKEAGPRHQHKRQQILKKKAEGNEPAIHRKLQAHEMSGRVASKSTAGSATQVLSLRHWLSHASLRAWRSAWRGGTLCLASCGP